MIAAAPSNRSPGRPGRTRARLANLTFHGIGEPPRPLGAGERAVWLDAARFERILDAIAGREDVRVTFDDGNASDVALALPALEARGLQATFFVVAGRLDAPHFLARDDVARLVEAGMEIGTHGYEHRPWRGLAGAELERELDEARRVLEEVSGRRVRQASCPFGAYDRRLLGALRTRGYERVYTSDGGLSRADAWLQARTSLAAVDDEESVGAAVRAGGRGAFVGAARRAVKRWR